MAITALPLLATSEQPLPIRCQISKGLHGDTARHALHSIANRYILQHAPQQVRIDYTQ